MMNEKEILEQLGNWGYRLLPEPYPDCLGASGLLVAIRDPAATLGFAPHSLRLYLSSERRGPESVTLSEKPVLGGRSHVCPGTIRLTDANGARIDFFTFGGSLQVIVQSGRTLYAHESSAPILSIHPGDFGEPAEKLAARVQIALARAIATCCPDEHLVRQQLCAVEPLRLYMAAIHSLMQDCHAHIVPSDHYLDLCQVLEHQKRCLENEGKWPASPPTLLELLLPDEKKGQGLPLQ